jgi:FHA domain-containing protein
LGRENAPSGAQPTGAPREELPRPTPAAETDKSGEILWRSFLEGAGIELTLPNGPSPKLLREIGEILKIAVAGIQSLVTMRAKAKNEMRADMTLIQERDNNPLKFSPDATLALERILQPSARGFLSGSAALRDAVSDLQSHQAGMTAGMQSAMEALLERFDPAKMEALSPKPSLLDRLSPAHRRARLWELYAHQYRSLQEEIQRNFKRYCAEALREGYEAEVRNLAAASDPPGPGQG